MGGDLGGDGRRKVALFFFITNFYESIITFIDPPLQLLSDGPGKLHTKGWSLLGHQDQGCQSTHTVPLSHKENFLKIARLGVSVF